MGCGIKAAYEEESDSYYSSNEYRKRQGEVAHWNTLLNTAREMKVKDLTVITLAWLLEQREVDCSYSSRNIRFDTVRLEKVINAS